MISMDKGFIRVIPYFAEDIGYGYEDAVCTFPGDLDEYALSQGEGFDDVEFGTGSEEGVVLLPSSLDQ